MRTVLVAGGAGYIGSHTAKHLTTAGITPVVLDNFCTGNRFAAKFGPVYEGEISDAALVQRIAAEHQPAGAILFAGHINVGESTGNPSKYFRNNVSETLVFLDALVAAGVKNLVFSSSCAVYGMPPTVPIAEDAPKDPLSPYAESKLALERVLRWYDAAYGLKYAALRYFNAAGADPEGDIGEYHNPETHLIPLVIYAAMGRSRLKVFGTDYETPDGTAIRDYIHVNDLAVGHLRALQLLQGGAESFAVNVGTGTGHSVLEVIRKVEDVAGKKVPVDYGPRRLGDARELVSNPTYARQILGWDPKVSDLPTIVKTAWAWHESHPLPPA